MNNWIDSECGHSSRFYKHFLIGSFHWLQVWRIPCSRRTAKVVYKTKRSAWSGSDSLMMCITGRSISDLSKVHHCSSTCKPQENCSHDAHYWSAWKQWAFRLFWLLSQGGCTCGMRACVSQGISLVACLFVWGLFAKCLKIAISLCLTSQPLKMWKNEQIKNCLTSHKYMTTSLTTANNVNNTCRLSWEFKVLNSYSKMFAILEVRNTNLPECC